MPKLAAAVLALGLVVAPGAVQLVAPAAAQTAASRPSALPSGRATSSTPGLRGRVVERVRVVGNTTVSTASILNLIRTREGDKYDPETIEEDYQRIYRELRKFSNVTARAEPTATGGVVVVFEVDEQKQINSISFRGNKKIDAVTLRNAVDLRPGEAIDTFRLRLAENALEGLYRERGFPFARVTAAAEPLAARGDVVFEVVEGPAVRIRNVDFKGAKSFDESTLKGRIKTQSWMFILRPGRYDPEQVEQDVAALRRFYQGKGFFDVRVGRKLIWSPDQTELQVEFLIDEGPRYRVNRVIFENNNKLTDVELRNLLKLTEGRPFDAELLERDVRRIVKAYSPFGFIYQQGGFDPRLSDPDYLYVDAKRVYQQEPGAIDLVYSIHEGKPFRVGQIRVNGNTKTKDNVILRDMRFAPGELFDAAELRDAAERLRTKPYFEHVNITPIGDDPVYRDILVEVIETRTAQISLMGGINSNGGLGGGITYVQRNFDVANVPEHWSDIFTDKAFTGGGQTFRATFEPGTIATNASLFFYEPYLFDQDYSIGMEAYLRDRKREHYDDRRGGGRVTVGKRFGYEWLLQGTIRGENVRIDNIEDPVERAPEIVLAEGNSTLTSAAFELRRDTRNPGRFYHTGSYATARTEFYGALGGDYTFQKFETSWDGYFTLHEDLTERRTVLGLHANAGYITGESVFFERFYGGGLGSVRGFRFRGISPRGGLEEDPVGGDFALTGTAEVIFPLVGETLRGVVFADAGTVERELEIGTIRSGVGAGFRLVLPILGQQMPLAVDFAYPVTRGDEDDTQIISFSFGLTQ
jgi:outer membrane protein insertion porin family